MNILLILAIRVNQADEVECVRWALADGVTNSFKGPEEEADVETVIKMLEDGWIVEIRRNEAGHFVSGGRLQIKTLPNGRKNVQVEEEISFASLIAQGFPNF